MKLNCAMVKSEPIALLDARWNTLLLVFDGEDKIFPLIAENQLEHSSF